MHAEHSTMSVNLAPRNEFATVDQAQERRVTEGPELAVVIPTLNERDNIGLLDTVLDTVSWEVIFVDNELVRRHVRADP
jgi:hypothetical protein